MKFGIFYEMQLPRPWAADSEYNLYQNALTQIELADRLGYDYAWEVEHHFLEEYSHSSAPEVFLAAASQRTKRIRLGHGIFQVTTNHPAKVAAKVSVLDLLSNGRVELGMGESASITELEPFNVPFDEKRAIFEEAVAALVPMFAEGGHSHSGRYFNFPPRNVLPKPRQKPHPPLWTACSQLQTIAYAGEKGLGALGFQFVSADAAHAWVHAYYNGMTKRLAKLADYPVNPNIALVSMFMCAKTDEEARARADGATFFQFCLRFYNSADRKRPGPGEVDMWAEYTKWKAANPENHASALTGGLIGSPETIRKKLRKFEASHIDQVILLNQAGHTTHQDICDSLEMFADEVMPEFHANIPEQDAWKRDVLAGRIELEDRHGTFHGALRRQVSEGVGMQERALVLGGGGPVGVAWEAGLLAGLLEEGVDVRRADFVLGTSAGSIVGSAVAAGVDLDVLAEAQRNPAQVAGAGAGPPDLSKLMALMMQFPPTGEPSLEQRKELGQLSLSSSTIPEDQFVTYLGGGLAPGGWPDKFACTAVDAETGEFHVWRKADGVELARGVSSSCSVPGIFPPVTIKGKRWMDGGMRSSISIDMAAGYKRVLAIAVIPAMARAWLMPRFEAEGEAVRKAGGEMQLIGPDDASSEAFGTNLMDGSRRPAVMEAGRAQGRKEVARVKAFWG